MKLELTSKDVRLLKVMFSLLVAVMIGNFLILPQINRRSDLKMQLENVTATADDMQAQIDLIPSLQTAIMKAEESFDALSAPYYGPLENRQIDEIVTGLVLKHGLFPGELRIEDGEPAIPGPYLYSNIGNKEKSDFISSAIGSGRGYVNMSLVSVTVSGEEDAILALIDDIDKNEASIQLRSFSISRDYYLNKDLEMRKNISANCVFAVFTCSEL